MKKETKEIKKYYYKKMSKPLYPTKKKKIVTYEIVSFDIETINPKNHFYMGGISDADGYHAFYNKKKLADTLISKKYTAKNTLIYATNLSFDFFGIYGDDQRINDFKFIFRDSQLLQATYYGHGKNKPIIFRDTFSIAPLSLEQLGNIINTPKEKKPSCLGRKPLNEKEKKELEKYNRRDTLVTKKFMEFWQEKINQLFNTNLEITIGRQALIVWTTNYLPFNLHHEKTPLNDFIFKAYYGGRTENFKRGLIKNVKAYDVNSLYPSVMLDSLMPLPSSALKVKKPCKAHLLYEGVSYAQITMPEMDIPPLPLRLNNKLCFPTGTWKGYYTHADLRYAKENGARVLLLETVIYRKKLYLFKEYVEDLYKKRQEAQNRKSNEAIIFKLLLNSLYGKFGSRKITDVDLFNIKEEEGYKKYFENKKSVTLQEATGLAYTTTNSECESSYVFPIIPAYISSYARIKMHKLMKNVKNVIYTDTDSIYTTEEMKTSNSLGALKLEADIKSAIFVRPKAYLIKTFDGKTIVKLKGLSKATEDDFKKILKAEKVNKELFVKLKTALKKGYSFNEIINVEKGFSLEDNKRSWEKPFNPLEFQESKALNINLKPEEIIKTFPSHH